MSKKAVHYVENIYDIAFSVSEPFTIFKSGGQIKTVMTETDLFKDVAGFGDVETAYECLYLWKQAGYSGSPSSPVSFFREVHKQPTNIKAGTNFSLKNYFHGGWITNFASGFHHGSVYLYDIKNAYLWAGSMGLPLESRFFSDKPRSKDFIAVVKIKNRKSNYPDFLQKDETVITSEDLEIFDIEYEIKYGFDLYQFDYFPQQELEKINYLPEKCYKLATQSYWGIWAMSTGVDCERVRDTGEIIKWNLWNRNMKMIWSILIVHRVIQKVYNQVSDNSVNVYVDSILTKSKIKTGNEIGDWVFKNKFDGVFVRNAGVWTSIDNYLKNQKEYKNWIKHSGF